MYIKIKHLAKDIDDKKRELKETTDSKEQQLIRQELRDLQLIYRTLINEED